MSRDPFSSGPCPVGFAFFTGIALLGLLACPFPVSKHPLFPPGESQVDDRLAGVWYMETEDGRVYIHVAETHGGTLHGVSVEHAGKRGLDLEACEGFTTQLDQRRFLNISQCVKIKSAAGEYTIKKQSDGEAPYLIVLYEINTAGELTFRGISAEYVIESIQAGRLAGSVEDGVKITASTPDLVQFIAKSDPDRLFFKPKDEKKRSLVFRKLVIPTTSD